VQAELVGDLGGVHGVGQILLVGEHEQQGVTELVLVEHALELLTCLGNTLSVVRVDDENDTVRVLEVWWMSCAQSVEGSAGQHVKAWNSKMRHGAKSSSEVELTVPPERSDLVLSSDVPHGERDVLVFDSLDVEACALRNVG